MAQIHFNLKQPYKDGVQAELKRRRAENKDIQSLLNPRETRVLYTLTIDRNHRIKIKSDVVIAPKDWDFNNERVKKHHPNCVDINSRLNDLKSKILKAYDKVHEEGATFEEIKTSILYFVKYKQMPAVKVEDKPKQTFFEVFDEYLTILSAQSSPLTVRKFNTLKDALKEFEETNGIIQFSTMTMSFYDLFKGYLLTTKINRQGKPGLLNDTIQKYLKGLKQFLKWGHERGKHENTIYQHPTFKTTIRPKDRTIEKNNKAVLVEGEIYKLQSLDLTDKPHLEKIRDLFLVLIYTGQRWGDVQAMKKEQIKNGSWEFVTQKTDEFIRVPFFGLTLPAYDLLKKYDFTPPQMSMAYFDREIKIIGKLAGIDTQFSTTKFSGEKKFVTGEFKYEFLSSKVGRSTFITLALEHGMPINILMEITGHADYKTVMGYVRTNPEKVKYELERIGNVLSPNGEIFSNAM